MTSRYIFLELDPARSMQLKENAIKHVKTFQYHMRTHLRGIGGSGVCIVQPEQASEAYPLAAVRNRRVYQRYLVERGRWQPICQRSFLSSHEQRRTERTRTRKRRSWIGNAGHR